MGRFVARLDSVATTNEFQRADCSPRAGFGDGQLKVTDWVQAGRYLAGFDALSVVGGPFSEISPTVPGSSGSRRLLVVNANVGQTQTATVAVNLESQGNENALGFTMAFDPAAFVFSSVQLGSGAVGANLISNTSQVGNGKLGIILALASGGNFTAGVREVVKVNLVAAAPTGVFPLTFTDHIVTRCVADVQAGELPVTFVGGNVSITASNQLPTLAIARLSNSVVVSWPAWAGDFSLQAAASINGMPITWSNTPGPLQTNGGEIHTTLPFTNQTQFFRLRR